MPLDAPHSMMNKFHGPGDANFGLVSSTIKKMVGIAPEIALSQREGTYSSLKSRITNFMLKNDPCL